MKTFIGNILFLAALILIMSRFLSVWAGTPFPIDLVTSESMSPTLEKGDVVAWAPTKIEDVKVGDVIVFKSYLHWPEEKLLVHRVTDIKHDTKGNILLETKGDANEYIDQAGPHIPEPYIREKNLMGKAISIGQTPLKIPFVGNIGIWINDGVKSLSAPTSSKESYSYLGIFAPLTISVVILVILLFVIPEKGKTIKEKIKLYRFGPGQLDLKKILVLFFVIYFAFFTVIHVFAYDSVTASVGIQEGSKDSDVDFGRIVQGTESFPQDLPLINPSVSNVKGVVYGRGEIEEYVSRKVFQLDAGETQNMVLQAKAENNSKNGSYLGNIIVYSSPFWMIYPDDFIQNLVNWDAEATVYCLDLFTALILTTITGTILIILTVVSSVYGFMSIDLSWRRAPKTVIKKQTIKKMGKAKISIKKSFTEKIGWIGKTDLAELDVKGPAFKSFIKPFAAAIIALPIAALILYKLVSIIIPINEFLVMVISVFITGVTAYMISCKRRSKIVLTVMITMIIVTAHMMIQSNLIIIEKEQEMAATLSYSLGAIGIYLLVFGLLLVPLALASCAVVRGIRNLKERKDPLLMLEGKCDL